MNGHARMLLYLTVLYLGWNASPGADESWTPPDSLVGTYEGTALCFVRIANQTGADSVRMRITILPNGTVEGTAGGAAFVQCRVTRNRGWLGRKLNLGTDWWIQKGLLEGPVVPGDAETRREISLPFNMVQGCLRGSLFERKGWRYPNPILPRLHLRKGGMDEGS